MAATHAHRGEAGFTLAGLLIIMTIMAVFVAWTVPRQWSLVMARERDQQTLFAMRQYARAIDAFTAKHGGAPTSLQQLKEARTPRVLRGTKGELLDPLTGQADWIPVTAGEVQANPSQQQVQLPPDVAPTTPQASTTAFGGFGFPGQTATGVAPVRPAAPIGGTAPGAQTGEGGQVVGPIVGVRPNKTGKSYLVVNGADQYEQWAFTTVDLKNEIQARQNSLMVK